MQNNGSEGGVEILFDEWQRSFDKALFRDEKKNRKLCYFRLIVFINKVLPHK